MTVIDTPGLGEEDIEKEVKLMYEIVEKLKNRVKLVHVFIIVLNGEKTVLEEKDESLIRIFTKIFGNQIWNNVMLQASKWRFSEDGYHMREQQGGFQLEFVSISWVINHMTCYKCGCSH